MKRIMLPSAFVLLPVFFGVAFAGGNRAQDEKKEALAELNDFIGQWNGSGNLDGERFKGWREKADWSWRFKGKDAWLRLKLSDGKFFGGGELRYLPDREEFQFTLIDKDKKKRDFKGQLKRKTLVLEHVDPKTKEIQRIQMNNAAGGVRFVYTYDVKPANRTVFYKKFQVGFTKEGESFATAKRKVECVVTGGLGTISVSYNGVTYYVCCSGCRDAFNADPAKIIAAYKKKKKRGG